MKSRKTLKVFVYVIVVYLSLSVSSWAQRRGAGNKEESSFTTANAPYCMGRHDIGRLVWGITNFGMAGIGENNGVTSDCFVGGRVPLGEYPKGDNDTYFYKGGLWIGAIVNKDTLVSIGAEMNNKSHEFHPVHPMIKRSKIDPSSSEFDGAVSEQEYVAVYADTFTSGVSGSFDPIDLRGHKPIGVEVEQTSYSWSYPHTDDFIIIDYKITNVSNDIINDMFVGLYWDIDVHPGDIDVTRPPDLWGEKRNPGGLDDLGGLLKTMESYYSGCVYEDTIVLAWTADNEGDYHNGVFDVGGISGIYLLDDLQDGMYLSYNWFAYHYNAPLDYGPQHKSNYRYMGHGLGTPIGDKNKYHMLSNGEIDFDPIYTDAIQPTDLVWVEPIKNRSRSITRGFDCQYVLSVGPIDLLPGADFSFPVAFVAGENLHYNDGNFAVTLGYLYRPNAYYRGLNFTDFTRNAATAQRAWDTPGVDTDGDGYEGEFRDCEGDTFYYKGDGVPDLQPEAPPPSPDMWVSPVSNGIRIRFNGWKSETTPDIFSNLIDFEGYRVYIARDNREESYSLLASYDQRNYDKFIYLDERKGQQRFSIIDNPFTLDELRCLYGFTEDPCSDTAFDPLLYSRYNPYQMDNYPESLFYFVQHDYNRSVFGVETPIRKIYPNEPLPENPRVFKPEELTEDGYPKYYEYEFTVDSLLPNISYYVSVTAFDYGSFITSIQPLESSILLTAKEVYPDNIWDEKEDNVNNVYVFPNPYRDDEWYRVNGFEGLGEDDRIRNRVRKITFGNLPPHCTIKILTLDGDLIQEIDHNFDPGDPLSPYHEWDLISRNVQIIVSGLYYWVVEDDQGNTQIGKLTILL